MALIASGLFGCHTGPGGSDDRGVGGRGGGGRRVESGGLQVWPETPILDTSCCCCCHPLIGVPCLRLGPTRTKETSQPLPPPSARRPFDDVAVS